VINGGGLPWPLVMCEYYMQFFPWTYWQYWGGWGPGGDAVSVHKTVFWCPTDRRDPAVQSGVSYMANNWIMPVTDQLGFGYCCAGFNDGRLRSIRYPSDACLILEGNHPTGYTFTNPSVEGVYMGFRHNGLGDGAVRRWARGPGSSARRPRG